MSLQLQKCPKCGEESYQYYDILNSYRCFSCDHKEELPYIRPNSYTTCKSCSNCRHIEIIREYDSRPHYYCNIDESIRPKSGSVCMDECDMDNFDDILDIFEEWTVGRYVEGNGTCDKWEGGLE